MTNSFAATSKFSADVAEGRADEVLIPSNYGAPSIRFAIAPCSRGFVIIAVSEQLTRSIMVGEDPEMLVSDLQNEFPNDAIAVNENYDAGLVAKVVDLIDHPDRAKELTSDSRATDLQLRVGNALKGFAVHGARRLSGRFATAP